jgi:DNA modification methylase
VAQDITSASTFTKSEYWDIDRLSNWDKNPRSIKTERFEELKNRLKRQGQMKPILVTATGTVIGGNMRLRALKELNVPKVWVSVTAATNDKDIFDLALTDNEEFGYYEQEQVAELALSLGLTTLELQSYSLNLGQPTTLDLVLDKFGPEVEEDEVPDLDEENEPESKLGEIYQLGPHRLICGDSTDESTWTQLMDGSKADMVFIDPPYNVDYEGKTKDALKIENDKFASTEAFYTFLLDAFTLTAEHAKAGASIYVAHADSEGLNFRRAFNDAGFYMAQCIIWNKNVMVMGRQDYHWKHEPILYGWKKGGGHEYYGGRTQTTVWDIDRPSRSESHPTMKPLALMTKAMKNSSKLEDIVVDSFLGSGSTLIAAELCGRVCYGMELDPRYCDVVRKRYAAHIGQDDNWQEATPVINEELAKV